MKNKKAGMLALLALTLLALPCRAAAEDAQIAGGYRGAFSPFNVGGGFSYLPNGDIIGFNVDYINGPTLYRYDANGDGVPAAPQPIVQFDSSAFPSFVVISPSGAYALAGVTGSVNRVFKIDLATDGVAPYFDSLFNFDMAFIDESHAYLSSNPGGFNPSVPNRIELVDLTATPTFHTVAEIPDTPSGPIAVNGRGDLYYVKQTYLFPAPLLSSVLYKFSAESLAQALTDGAPLGVANSEAGAPLEGGADIVYNGGSAHGQLFVSTLANKVLRIPEDTLIPSDFVTLNDPTGPSLGFLSLYKPAGVFDTSATTQSVLGVAVTTDFFSTYRLLQVKTDTYDADGDKTPDISDSCPKDPAKTAVGICGCGVADIDSNLDAVVDCGSPRPYQTLMYPSIGLVVVQGTTVTMLFEKFTGKDVRYNIALIGPSPKTRVAKSATSKTYYYQFTKLKPGTYTLVFRVTNKAGRTKLSTLFSAPVQFTIVKK